MEFYQEKLTQPNMFSTKIIQQNISNIESGKGLTYFEMIVGRAASSANNNARVVSDLLNGPMK